jgi:hypothetical protein
MKRERALSAVVAACDFVLAVAYREHPPLAVLYLLAGVMFLVAGSLTRWARRAFLTVAAAQWMAFAVLAFVLGQTGKAVSALVGWPSGSVSSSDLAKIKHTNGNTGRVQFSRDRRE